MLVSLIHNLDLTNGELILITLKQDFVPNIPIIGKFFLRESKENNFEYYATIQDEVYIKSLDRSSSNHYIFGDPFKLTRNWVENVRKLTLLEKRVYNFNKYSYYE